MKYIKALVLSPKFKKSLLFSLLAGAISICSVMLMNYSVLFSFLSELLIQGNVKFSSYSYNANYQLSELFNIAVLFLVVIFVTKDPKRFYGLFTIQFIFVFLLGGDRVNMIAISLVLYYLIQERLLNNPLVIILLSYFTFKSVGFIQSIFLYGDGFRSSFL